MKLSTTALLLALLSAASPASSAWHRPAWLLPIGFTRPGCRSDMDCGGCAGDTDFEARLRTARADGFSGWMSCATCEAVHGRRPRWPRKVCVLRSRTGAGLEFVSVASGITEGGSRRRGGDAEQSRANPFSFFSL